VSRVSSSPPVHNIVSDSTIGTLIQVGVLNGPLHLKFVQQAPEPVDPLELAAHTLALSVFSEWRAEANAWGIAHAAPMRIRWRASWPDADHPYTGYGDGGGDVDHVGTMAEAFLTLTRQRLVVLGESGAGKTTLAVLLTLDLLTRRIKEAGEGPVPVILPLETWNAERDHLHTWLAARIAEEHPGLPRIDGRHPAERLVSEGKILPVLDGLDELPPHRRAIVVEALHHALRDGDPLILASRPAAYREAASHLGDLPATAVVEAMPVTGRDAFTHLTGAIPRSHLERWQPVLDELLKSPPKPVALALSNPLMLWLARRVYARSHTEPAELTDTGRFPDRASIEEHLLEGIVPAVLSPLPHSPDRLHAPGRWNTGRARRYLGFLATHLARRHETDFAWWQLYRNPVVLAVTPFVLAAVCAVIAWGVGAMGTVLAGTRSGTESTRPGTELAFSTGLVLTGLLLAFQRFWFRRFDGRPRRLANPFRVGAALRSASRAVSVGRAAKAVSIVIGSTTLLSAWALATAYTAPLMVMTVCSTLLSPLVLAVISAPSDTEDASGPDRLLRDERRALALSLATVAPLIGVGQGAMDWLSPEVSGTGVVWALLGWTGAAVVLVLFSPWSRWLLAKTSLAVLGRVPWSLMEFLRDAHKAGLLQRGGGTYRFRNARLQEHFSGRRGQGGGALPPAAPGPSTGGRRDFSSAGPWPPGKHRVATRELFAGIERTPLAERPNWEVREDGHSFRVLGRQRGITLAHWNTVAWVAPLHFVLFAAYGEWRTGLWWVLFWVGVGVVVTLVGSLRRAVLLDLQLTHDRLAYTVGRRSGVIAWRDIARVEVSKMSFRGWAGSGYGIVIALHPGVSTPHRSLKVGAGRYAVLPLMSITSTVPADLETAMARFAGTRWRVPSAGPSEI